ERRCPAGGFCRLCPSGSGTRTFLESCRTLRHIPVFMSAEPTKKLLIVDDEVDVHYSFTRLLAKEPLTIVTASSGEEGVRVLKKEKPDVVVMDIRMGKESGLDTLREMRKINPKQIILMMTAYGTSQTA